MKVMKKRYVMPGTEVMNVELSVVIAASPAEPSAQLNVDETVDAAEIEARRHNNVWEEEEEEEQY